MSKVCFEDDFKTTYKKYICREGAPALLSWLDSTDFFTAPASTKYHCSHEGGLCEHSLNVWYRLIKKPSSVEYQPETLAIVSLLHDVCKANFYKAEMRNTKDEKGNWVKVPYYTVEEAFPFGHGEKSVFLIERFIRLTEEEAVAIRYHMGGFSEKPGDYSCGAAFAKYPLALHLHESDLEATYLDEAKVV